MKEYLLLFRGGYDRIVQQSPKEFLSHMEKWKKWMKDLESKENFVIAQPLTQGGKKVAGKNKAVTDGPFMEGKEIVGGYLICKAYTYEGAIQIANGCPVLEIGGIVEVREITKMDSITATYMAQNDTTH
ncbi:MAG TPA: YciI family protein [Candidatus Acidoferrales bacterium]|nr:YciI family protein [Candidatus Acidoferrales bacterium]